MHEVISAGVTPTVASQQALHTVLAVPGDVSSEHLLELARCSVPRDRSLGLFTLGVQAESAAAGWVEPAAGVRPDYSPERVRTVLRAVHETRARTLVLGYPGNARGRSHFTDVVERVTAAAELDVVVCVERHQRPWRRVLVPYLYAPLDGAALGVARRLARGTDAEVTVLNVVEPSGDDADTATLKASLGGCTLKMVTAEDPVSAAADEARLGYDVIVLGGRQPRAGRGRYFTVRQQRLLLATDASLVIVHASADREP